MSSVFQLTQKLRGSHQSLIPGESSLRTLHPLTYRRAMICCPNQTPQRHRAKSLCKRQLSNYHMSTFSRRQVSSKACLFPFLCRNPIENTSCSVKSQEEDDNELEEKINTLQEMFPQLARTELLEVRRWITSLNSSASCPLTLTATRPASFFRSLKAPVR